MMRRATRSFLAQRAALAQRVTTPIAAPLQCAVFGGANATSAGAQCGLWAEQYARHFHSARLALHEYHRHGRDAERDVLPLEQVESHIKLMESWSCSGCGIDLQTDEPKKVGYMPKQLLAKIEHIRELKKLRCERCYNITHYGKITDAKLPYNEYEKRVLELKAKDMLLIQLVDILDISGSLLPKARHLFGNKDVMLVVNKGDLMPEKSGIRRLMRRIQSQAKYVFSCLIWGMRYISSDPLTAPVCCYLIGPQASRISRLCTS
jgi:hypothetical protein